MNAYSNSQIKTLKIEQASKVISPIKANWYQLLSIKLWGNLPSSVQRNISRNYSKIYESSLSKYFIKPYCKFHYKEENYLDQFAPPNGKMTYENFQDFFTRVFKELPNADSFSAWACEGTLCHLGKISAIATSNVKGDIKEIHTIFGVEKNVIPKNYFFSNVFLHNKNYHRIHAPVTGTVTRIQRIKGDLVVLRPWIYPNNPSIPAFRNERVNIDIVDKNGATWYLSVVGGPAVGTIEIPSSVYEGATVEIIEEIATFYMGSTCCIASPKGPKFHSQDSLVEMGQIFY